MTNELRRFLELHQEGSELATWEDVLAWLAELERRGCKPHKLALLERAQRRRLLS